MRALVLIGLLSLGACGGGKAGGLGRAEGLMARGDYAGAEREADAGLRSAPSDEALWRLRIDAVQRQGDQARAVELYFEWHRLRRHYDNRAIRALAEGTLRNDARHDSAAVRRQALAAVVRFRSPAARAAAEAALDDGDPSVRARAAAAVLAADWDRDGRALRLLVELAGGDHAGARAAAVTALARRGDHRKVVMDAVDDPSPVVRRAAVRGLAALGGDGSATRLLAALADRDGTVRAEALGWLARRDDERTLAAAMAALEDDYLGVRLAAIRVLGGEEKGRARLAEMTRSADAYVALRAAVQLRKSGAEVDPAVIDRAMAARRWNVRVAALNAVAEVAPRGHALQVVSRGLVDDRFEVRLAAARVLVRYGLGARASQTFHDALESPRGDLRVEGALALLRMGDRGGLDALGELVTSAAQPEVRASAAFALSQTENVSLPLVRALADGDPAVRLAAATALLSLLD